MLRVLSLGAGVQSSCVALMVTAGELPPVDCAIFADTGWEPKKVYKWLNWLEPQLSFPVYRVSAGNLRTNVLESKNTTGGRFATIPWFILSPRGKKGMGRRQCTSEYKLGPIRKKKRELLGYKPRSRIPVGSCETLICISVDEAHRMKPATDRWDKNTFPLIDKGMHRYHCGLWMDSHGFPRAPKSACLACPYHSDEQWREIKEEPDEWADVLFIDQAIREPVRGQRGRQYMHADRKPMAEVDLLSPRERGQTDAFINECEGICGV